MNFSNKCVDFVQKSLWSCGLTFWLSSGAFGQSPLAEAQDKVQPAVSSPVEAASPPSHVAVLGDSLATGAATHPALAFDAKVLWDIFDGRLGVIPRASDIPAGGPWNLSDPLPAPIRLWPSKREYFGGPDWVFRNMMQSVARTYLDTEEYSWGYLVTSGLGIPPSQLLIAAENGARVEAIPRQLDRVLDATGGELPAKILLMYTGNDLCGPTAAEATSAKEYGAHLQKGFGYLLRNGKASKAGTDVYLLSHLGVLQLLYAEPILAKKIRAFGSESTCGELRAHSFLPKDPTTYDPGLPPHAWWFGMMMPPNPAAYCPTLFGAHGSQKEKEEILSSLANRIRDYREIEGLEIARAMDIAAKAGLAVRFHYVTGTADLKFSGEDIAQDCFHLAPSGQAKVARAVLRQMGVM